MGSQVHGVLEKGNLKQQELKTVGGRVKMCPACGSGDVRQGCCGDTVVTCLKCGHRWEGVSVLSCPVPVAQCQPGCGSEIETNIVDRGTEIFVGEEYHPLTQEQLWGE